MQFMRATVRELFHELADVPRAERDRILTEREIAAELRAELESLLSHDVTSAASLTRCVSHAAQEALSADHSPFARSCGPYRLVKLLGSGGMGSVYLAERRDGEIEHKVAIKLLRSDADRPVWRERFLRERQLLAYLNHPSIARLLDAGHTEDGRPYLVMEHIKGVAIDEYAAPLDLRAQVELFLRVCEGVSHAHRHLIIHRDLKPSNILVDALGHPKLLDFGIAKLLDTTTDETQTVERLLTPNYASPEQLRGEIQTATTDIYSLGAVLYKLLTGLSPHEQFKDANLTNRAITGGIDITAPSRLNPKLPRDIDHILRKALRNEPEERYSSVDAFADDLRAFLDFRPVQARSGDAWYRIRKFLRRYWIPASAAAVTVAGLSLGMYAANRERALAQQRFQQVRQLANRVLGLDAVVGALQGSTKARNEIVAMSKEYLESLTPKARDDKELALETGQAYVLLARTQGVPGFQNLGQYAQAEESLRKAESLIEPVLAASPRNRQALLALAGISEGLMTLARQADRADEETLAYGGKAARRLDLFLALGPLSPAESKEAARVLYRIAKAYRNLHLHDAALNYARRSTEVARSLPPGEGSLADGLSLLADLTRISGDLDGALRDIREARTILEQTDYRSERLRLSWFLVLWCEGVILGGGNGLNLNQPEEAAAVLQRAFDVLEEWAQSDPNDASARLLFNQTGRELGAILRDRDPRRALAVYDQARRRLGEVRNSAAARRAEAGMLAGSSYALRRLNRIGEARNRIEAVLRLLRETKDYPTDRIDTDSEVEPALRALADHLADTGEPVRAAAVYQELLDLIMAAKPDLENDLRRAIKLSRIYEALASLERRNHRAEKAEAVSALRRNLWLQWDRKLPGNAYVHRQFQAAGG
jgi:tRNA A-37 threonylcarbamoyl transferase component Bud32/tetratricopeptide (TPR) repeat protein